MADMFNLNFKFYVQVQTRPCIGLFPRQQQGNRKQTLRPRNPFQQTPPRRPPSHRLLPPPQNPLPKTNPNHLLLPRRTLKAHHQRAPNPLPSTQPRARPPASPIYCFMKNKMRYNKNENRPFIRHYYYNNKLRIQDEDTVFCFISNSNAYRI